MANEGFYSTFGRFSLGSNKFCYEKIRRLDRARILNHSDQVMCGTLEHNAADTSPDIMEYGFEVILQPTYEELAVLLPMIGFPSAGSGVYRPNDTVLPTIDHAMIDEGGLNVRDYANAKIDKAVFMASRSSAMRLRLVVRAKTATDGASFTATAVSGSSSPYSFVMSALTLNSLSLYTSSWVFAVDNRLNVEFNNNVTATNIDQRDRVQHVLLNIPYNTEGKPIHDTMWGADRNDGFGGSLAFTRGAKSATFAWDVLKGDGTSPDFLNRDELRQDLTFRVFDNTVSPNSAPSSKVTLATAS